MKMNIGKNVKFLHVVITGEYIFPYCWSFSTTDAHLLRAVNQTNISAHSCNPSEQLFSKKTSNLAINSPQAGTA